MKKFLAATVVIVVTIVLVGSYFFSQLTYTPAWYQPKKPVRVAARTADAERAVQQIHKIERLVSDSGTAEIAHNDAAAVMVHLAGKKMGVDAVALVKGAKTSVDKENLRMEMVVNVAGIPHDKLPRRAAKALDRVLALTPDAILDELYLKVELTAPEDGGPPKISPRSKVFIGKMCFSVAELEKRTGVSAQAVLDRIGWTNFVLKDGRLLLCK